MDCGCTATVEQDPFVVRIGDNYRFAIAVSANGGGPAVLDGAILDFGYGVRPDAEDRENADRPSAQPDLGTETRDGVIYPAVEITIPSAETDLLVDGVIYYWAARATISGIPNVVASGTFTASSVPL